MKKMIFLSKNWYFSVQKALIYYTVNKSHHNSFILLVFSPVANFRYVANFRFLTLLSMSFTGFEFMSTGFQIVLTNLDLRPILLCMAYEMQISDFCKWGKTCFCITNHKWSGTRN